MAPTLQQTAPPARPHLQRGVVAARHLLARVVATVASVGVILGCGVLTGLRVLDGSSVAPWLRSVALLAALTCLAGLAAAVSRTLANISVAREASSGYLLHKHAVGPARRWAIWIAISSTACVVSYLLNEHRPADPTLADLIPARAIDVAVILVGARLVSLYVHDLYSCARTRGIPWSRPTMSLQRIRQDDDVVGAISRMSPPLLVAMCLLVAMFIATFVVGIYHPAKLVAGAGVVLLFAAGLLAAPALLRVQGEPIEPAWRRDWYKRQRALVASLRTPVVHAHRVVIVVQVAMFGVGLGAVASGSPRFGAPIGRLLADAVIVAAAGFALSHTLWLWSPGEEEPAPIDTHDLASRERMLLRLAGWALVLGSACSLVAVLTG